MSAFCELYKVKINATKSYYAVDRGDIRNEKWEEIIEKGSITLWDHTANGGVGQWQTVKEVHPKTPIRYLGVMISTNGDASVQANKVDREVMKRLDKIKLSFCPAEMTNYMIKAVVGGLLNYHAPFTRITKGMLERWDNKVREVLRHKTGIRKDTVTGALYDEEILGLGWYSPKATVYESVLTEGLIVLTSNTLEGRMIRQQVADFNKDRGTIYSPWMIPKRDRSHRSQWQSSVITMENVLADIGWNIDSDVAAWGKGIESRQEMQRGM